MRSEIEVIYIFFLLVKILDESGPPFKTDATCLTCIISIRYFSANI